MDARRPLNLSSVELADLVDDLRPRAVGGRVRAVRAVEGRPDELVLRLRTHEGDLSLRLSTHPGRARIHATDQNQRQPPEAPAFVMAARRRMEDAVLTDLSTLPGERIAVLAFAGPLGDGRLVVELLGRRAALVLVDETGTIVHVHATHAPREGVRAGVPWEPPPPRDAPTQGRRPGWPDHPHDAHALVEAIAEADLRDEVEQASRNALQGALRDARKRLASRRAQISRDLERVSSADALRHEAELLVAAPRPARGAASIEVTDWSDPDQRRIAITLDPALSFAANVERRWHQYRRMRRGEERVLERLGPLEDDERALDLLELRAPDADSDQARDILAALRARRLLARPQAPPGPRNDRDAPRLPYRRFLSSDGIDILVGRGPADNDTLTLRVARGNDLWLHAMDWPGAHVIVRTPRGGQVPRRTLEEAALLAAHHCKGRDDGVVTIGWTERKHVRKPRGLPPGRVLVADRRAVDVRLDDPRLPELFRRAEDIESEALATSDARSAPRPRAP